MPSEISAPKSFALIASETTRQGQNKNDDGDDPDNADPAMPEAIAVSTEATTEAPEQEYDQNDEKNIT